MTVLVDGVEVYSTNLPNLDGTYNVDEEYNTNFTVSIPSGKHLVTITNTGADWFYLDWVQLNQVLPATYAGNGQPTAAAIGLRGANESLLYIVAPGVSWPANATTATLRELRGETVTLTNWPAGNYFAERYDPATADFLGRNEATATNGGLTLTTPEFYDDIVGLVYPQPRLGAAFFSLTNEFEFQLESETVGN